MIRELYRKIVPQKIRSAIGVRRILLKQQRFLSQGKLKEYESEIEWLLKNGAQTFPYDWTKEYNNRAVEVYIDEEDGLSYVIHNGKKLFFANTDLANTRFLYNQFCMEQDARSPHKYFSKLNEPNRDDVFVDIGAAEGMMALDYVDKVKKVYLIECEEIWIKALKKTFEGYNNVEIVNTFIGRPEDGGVTLSSVLQQDSGLVLKMDIEGNEIAALAGMRDILDKSGNKYAICTYHNVNDEKIISEMFNDNDINYEFSDGYMFIPSNEKRGFPCLRKGMIRGRKINTSINKETNGNSAF